MRVIVELNFKARAKGGLTVTPKTTPLMEFRDQLKWCVAINTVRQ